MDGSAPFRYRLHDEVVRIEGSAGLRVRVALGVAAILIAGLAVLGGAHLERRASAGEDFRYIPATNPTKATAEHSPGLGRLPINDVAIPLDSNRWGLGVRVGDDFHILTSRHVVDACPRLDAVDSEGAHHRANHVADDVNNDLALIRAETLPRSPGIMVRAFPPPRFNEALSYIRPRAFSPEREELGVGFARVADLARRTDSRLVTLVGEGQGKLSAFLGGDSGGPVTDPDGHLLGIIVGTLPRSRAQTTRFAQNIGFMINGGLIELFLHANRVDYRVKHTAPEHPPHPQAEILRYTVEVFCER